jgi:hypothetical protein
MLYFGIPAHVPWLASLGVSTLAGWAVLLGSAVLLAAVLAQLIAPCTLRHPLGWYWNRLIASDRL